MSELTAQSQCRLTNTNFAVVTAANASFFPGARLLAASVMRCPEPAEVICVDLGLTATQRVELEMAGVTVVPEIEPPFMRVAAGISALRLKWYTKPWYISESFGYQRLLWIDADAIVLNDLHLMRAMLDNGPIFTRGLRYVPNSQKLYELFPVPAKIAPLSVNAGVVGLDLSRDAFVLVAWREMVARAVADERRNSLRRMMPCADQGALLWAIHACNLTARIFDDGLRWNYPGRRLRPERSNVIELFGYNSETLFEKLGAFAAKHPEIAIAHWWGRRKPWQRRLLPD